MTPRLDSSSSSTAYDTLLRAETRYLNQRAQGRQSRLQQGIIGVMVPISLLSFIWTVLNTIPQESSLLYWLLTTFGFDVSDYYSSRFGLNNILAPVTLLFPLGMLIWELWLLYQTLAMSTSTISRERNGNSWELLLLTNVSAG